MFECNLEPLVIYTINTIEQKNTPYESTRVFANRERRVNALQDGGGDGGGGEEERESRNLKRVILTLKQVRLRGNKRGKETSKCSLRKMRSQAAII